MMNHGVIRKNDCLCPIPELKCLDHNPTDFPKVNEVGLLSWRIVENAMPTAVLWAAFGP